MSRSARGARPRSDDSSAGPLASRISLSCGRRRNSRPVSRKLAAKVSAGSSIDCGEPVQQRAVGVEHVGDRGLEQLLLAVEVVVEGTHPDVGGLGDLQDRHVDLALGDEPLRGLDQRRPGALLAPLQAVGRLGCVGIALIPSSMHHF